MTKTAEEIKNELMNLRKRRVVHDALELIIIWFCLLP